MLSYLLSSRLYCGFGVSPNHALRLVGCTTGRESHPALKILDSISGSIIAWYITECKPFLKPGQNRDGTTFRRRTLSRGLAPSSSLSFCQSFHRVFLQAAKVTCFQTRACRMAGRTGSSSPSNEKQSVPCSRVPIKQYLQKLPKWGRFGVTSVTPFLLLPVHPEGYTPAHHT